MHLWIFTLCLMLTLYATPAYALADYVPWPTYQEWCWWDWWVNENSESGESDTSGGESGSSGEDSGSNGSDPGEGGNF